MVNKPNPKKSLFFMIRPSQVHAGCDTSCFCSQAKPNHVTEGYDCDSKNDKVGDSELNNSD
jgi:hypothetical protein